MLAAHLDPANCHVIEAIGQLQRDEFDYYLDRELATVHKVSTALLVSLDDHAKRADALKKYPGVEAGVVVAVAILADRNESRFVSVPAVPCGRMRREIHEFVASNQSHRSAPWFNVAIRQNCLSLRRFEEMLGTYPALMRKWQSRKGRLCLEVAQEWLETI